MQLLNSISEQVAVPLAQVQLEQQLHQHLQYQTLVDKLTGAVRNTSDPTHIFKLAIEGAVSALHIDRGGLFLFKYLYPIPKHQDTSSIPETRAILEHLYVRQTAEMAWQERTDLLPEQPSASAAKQSFWISDCPLLHPLLIGKEEPIAIARMEHPVLSPEQLQSASSQAIAYLFAPETTASLLVVPLAHQGTVLGALVLIHHRPRRWDFEEIAFVRLVTAQLSTTIIQSQTLRQVQALVEERTAQLERSLEVQAKLYEKTRQQVEQLRHLTQCQEEFLSTVSHELLTPLTSMAVAIRMLRQAELTPERREKYLNILEQQCNQETNLINDLLTLQKLESGTTATHLQPLDVRHLMRDLVQSCQSQWESKLLQFDLALPDRAVNLKTDLESFSRILTELVTNAGKYAIAESTVQIQITQSLDQKVNPVVISIANFGYGISPEELPRIFDKFSRGEGMTSRAVPGTGLGLALVKGLVEHLNGKVTVSSHPIDESDLWHTCFTLTLPQSAEFSLL